MSHFDDTESFWVEHPDETEYEQTLMGYAEMADPTPIKEGQ